MKTTGWKPADSGWPARSVLECGRAGSPLSDAARWRHRALPIRLLLFCLLTSALCLRAWGQYSLDWFTIDGGGGTSPGGVYSVTGTIGQPDVGAMSGGSYTLAGGLWGIIAAVQMPGTPLLSITLNPQLSTINVSWPSPSLGWNLQQNTNSISSVNWSNVTATIQDDDTTKTLIVNPPTGKRFYRLHKP